MSKQTMQTHNKINENFDKLEAMFSSNVTASIDITDDLLHDIQLIIETAQGNAHSVLNQILVERNWSLGRRISIEELKGENRAQYGASVIVNLSDKLTSIYGKGFTKTNLHSYLDFYNNYPEIFHMPCGKSKLLLSWSHFRTLLQVKDETARDWYMNEAIREVWSVKTL